MGVSPVSKIRTFNEDARWFVMNRRETGVYDVIFQDAFNDLSIPYHLTTQEFSSELRRLLKKDGLLVTNVIDRFEKGSFLPSYIRTLEQVFGKGAVHLVMLAPGEYRREVENRVVIANLPATGLLGLLENLSRIEPEDRISHVLAQDRLQGYLNEFRPPVLTDDYVPVDVLTAANFR
jgi:hypothetical protein